MQVILGTMSIGSTLDAEKTSKVLSLFKKAGHSQVDTAIMYVGGESEKVLGQVGATSEFQVATKANPWFSLEEGKTTTQLCAGLKPESLRKQVDISLTSLACKKVPLLYLHAPDHETPILDILKTVAELKKEDKFEEWGLSNYSSWQVSMICELCRENGFPLPTVYQGMYNCITRAVEAELFPCLRFYGLRFYAYNPLAGGMLSGKYTPKSDPEEGRFSNKTVWGAKYRERFWNKQVFSAVDLIGEACKKHEISLIDASMRWLGHHSKLETSKGDAVIIGGSSIEHIESNVTACAGGPLPEDVVNAIDEAWFVASPVCPKYFR